MEELSLAELSPSQQEALTAYQEQLLRFNRQFNLISRESDAADVARHVRHCLALTARPFPPGSVLVDWGTGGGLPAVPLAIAFPEIEVYAVDAVGKKIQAVKAMARRLGLENLHPWHGRAEAWPGRAHYSVSRATAPLAELWRWHHRVVQPFESPAGVWPQGLICLKGGDLTEEIAALREQAGGVCVEQMPLDTLIADPFFATKSIVVVTEPA